MTPSFEAGDYLIVRRGAYGKTAPSRGDPVILRDPGDAADGTRVNLKRVIGLPGDEVRLYEGTLYINGEHLVEPYLGGLPASPGLGGGIWRLADNEFFVMGDNRAHSTDSRAFGPVAPGLLAGKAWFRIWPIGRWGYVD